MKSRGRQPSVLYCARCPFRQNVFGDRSSDEQLMLPRCQLKPRLTIGRAALMYCPTCSTLSSDGMKFCKSCGMNLSVVTQALSGGVVVSDPLRDREFKRTRKQISDGIHGSAVGAALLVAAALPYFLIPKSAWVYTTSLLLALGGIVKLFRGVGSILDAKVGPKLVDPALQPRGTGGLNNGQPLTTGVRPSQRLSTGQPANTRAFALDSDRRGSPSSEAPPENLGRPMTGRINREHSSPLRAFDKDADLMSKLRN